MMSPAGKGAHRVAYRREKYLGAIRGFITTRIKVIMGVRRCGKSCLMRSIADELVESALRIAIVF